uniref:Ig-like domain-containing protein n=1 Tax=Sus scrofa TaxID=9823 RepID=F1RUY5_PIG
MSSPTSALEKGLVAWKAPLPPLLLLLLPLSGSWALSKAHHLQSVAGQTLSLRCQYPPKNGPYERKGWCKEVSELLCTGLVTSSRPHMLAQASRFSIWDSPSSGFFVVTMTGLREEDTGHYWCRIYPTSGYSVSKSVRFHLAVSPGEAPQNPVSSQTQSCTSSTVASSAIAALSQQENSTLGSSPAPPNALAPLLCGFFLTKGLVLSALLVQRLAGLSPQASERFLRSLRTQRERPASPKAPGAPPSSLSSEFPAEAEAWLNSTQRPARGREPRIPQTPPPPQTLPPPQVPARSARAHFALGQAVHSPGSISPLSPESGPPMLPGR